MAAGDTAAASGSGSSSGPPPAPPALLPASVRPAQPCADSLRGGDSSNETTPLLLPQLLPPRPPLPPRRALAPSAWPRSANDTEAAMLNPEEVEDGGDDDDESVDGDSASSDEQAALLDGSTGSDAPAGPKQQRRRRTQSLSGPSSASRTLKVLLFVCGLSTFARSESLLMQTQMFARCFGLGSAFYPAASSALFMPGIIVQLLQNRYDKGIDRRFGTFRAANARILTSLFGPSGQGEADTAAAGPLDGALASSWIIYGWLRLLHFFGGSMWPFLLPKK